MSVAFISGIKNEFPKATHVFDKFHVVKIINEALDEVRRIESNHTHILKNTRFLWLKNPSNLTAKQLSELENLRLSKLNLKTARAYHIKLNFQDFFNQLPQEAECFLKKWYFWATHSKLKPMIKAAKTIKAHWNGIMNWFNTRISNGILEGMNSLVQSAKSRARGYRNVENLITMTYLIGSGLKFYFVQG